MPHVRDRNFCLHGNLVGLRNTVAFIEPALSAMLSDFDVADWPEGFSPLEGTIAPYDAETVVRHLSPNARLVPDPDGVFEIYQDDDRCWMVDERWGLCEINVPRGTWRAWLLPRPEMDAMRCVEAAVLFPLAKLLRPRGVQLVSAASVALDDFGLLLLASCDMEPELSCLAAAGYDIIGQRWTALREEDGRVSMLRMPGLTERLAAPHRVGTPAATAWLDLAPDGRHHAFCSATLLVEPGRRTLADIAPLNQAAGQAHLKRRWPMPELTAAKRPVNWAHKLALAAPVCEARLARDPARFARMIELYRMGLARPTTKLHVSPARMAAAV